MKSFLLEVLTIIGLFMWLNIGMYYAFGGWYYGVPQPYGYWSLIGVPFYMAGSSRIMNLITGKY